MLFFVEGESEAHSDDDKAIENDNKLLVTSDIMKASPKAKVQCSIVGFEKEQEYEPFDDEISDGKTAILEMQYMWSCDSLCHLQDARCLLYAMHISYHCQCPLIFVYI